MLLVDELLSAFHGSLNVTAAGDLLLGFVQDYYGGSVLQSTAGSIYDANGRRLNLLTTDITLR